MLRYGASARSRDCRLTTRTLLAGSPGTTIAWKRSSLRVTSNGPRAGESAAPAADVDVHGIRSGDSVLPIGPVSDRRTISLSLASRSARAHASSSGAAARTNPNTVPPTSAGASAAR